MLSIIVFWYLIFFYLLQSHKIEIENTDEESPVKDTGDTGKVVNTGSPLQISQEIESENTDEELFVKDTGDTGEVVNMCASLPFSCDSDTIIAVETSAFNMDKMEVEAENTLVEGQPSDFLFSDDVMDIIDGYCKQSNMKLVNYSHSSGSASACDVFDTNEGENNNDSKQSYSQVNVSLK